MEERTRLAICLQVDTSTLSRSCYLTLVRILSWMISMTACVKSSLLWQYHKLKRFVYIHRSDRSHLHSTPLHTILLISSIHNLHSSASKDTRRIQRQKCHLHLPQPKHLPLPLQTLRSRTALPFNPCTKATSANPGPKRSFNSIPLHFCHAITKVLQRKLCVSHRQYHVSMHQETSSA